MKPRPLNKLDIFRNRLQKIGIEVKMYGNLPWIYIDYVNGKKVTEKYQGNHGFTVAFFNVRGETNFTEIKTIFELIRKYK